MKLRYAVLLALLLLTSCAPSIEQSTTRAEAAAARAERSATIAEQSADQGSKASARALVAANQIEDDARRADDAVSRLETPTVKHGDLLVKPTEGSPLFWCLMGPPIIQGSPMGSESIDWHAPRSRFWVGEIFDSKSDCHDALRKSHRLFADIMGKERDLRARLLPFRAFCAACANEGEDDED